MSTLEEVCDAWYRACIDDVKFLFGTDNVTTWPGICWSQRSLSYLYTNKLAEPWRSMQALHPGAPRMDFKHGRVAMEVDTHEMSEGEIVDKFVSGILGVLYKVSRQMLHDSDAQSEVHWIHRNQHIESPALKQFMMSSVFLNVLAASAIFFEHHQTTECFDVATSPPIVFWRRAQRKLKALNVHNELCERPAELIRIVLKNGCGPGGTGHMAIWGESYDPDIYTVVPLELRHRMLCACNFTRAAGFCDCSDCSEFGCHVCKTAAIDDLEYQFFKDITKQESVDEYGIPDPKSKVDPKQMMTRRVSRFEESQLFCFHRIEMENTFGNNNNRQYVKLQREKQFLLDCNCIMCVLPKLKMHMLEKWLKFNTFCTIRTSPRDMYVFLQNVRLTMPASIFATNTINDQSVFDMSLQDWKHCQVNRSKEFWKLVCETSSEVSALVVNVLLQHLYINFVQENPSLTNKTGFYHHMTCMTVNKFCAQSLNGFGNILAQVSDGDFERKLEPVLLTQLMVISYMPDRYRCLTHHHIQKLKDDLGQRSATARFFKCEKCRNSVSCIRNGSSNVILKNKTCRHMLCWNCVVQELLQMRPYRADSFKCPVCSTGIVRDHMT